MKEENDSTKQIEQFKLKIKEKGLIHQSLLEFLGVSTDDINLKNKIEGKTEEIYQNLKKKNILTNKCEFRDFLETISHLWEIHQITKEIKYKTESLLKILQADIKNIFSEKEIFSFFRFYRNHFILLILIEQNTISIETIIKNIDHQEEDFRDIIKFFYPEIRKYDEKYLNQLILIDDNRYELNEIIEKNDQNLEFFYEKRKEGVKEPKIIELIREDKIKEFISFIEHYPIDLNQKITKVEPTFGTNTGNLTPIEYSALFGSVAIFKYLYLKNVDINIIYGKYSSNIIEYAIQGRNYEIIHLLEERKEIKEELNNQEHQHKYLEISIKMHYNEIFEYLMGNYNIQITKEIIILIITCQNYDLFNHLIKTNQIELKDRAIITNVFHGICKNGNEDIVKILMNQPNLDINSKDEIFDHLSDKIKKKKKTITASR